MVEQTNVGRGRAAVVRPGLWISLGVLAATAVVLAILFFHMVQPLAVPLFLAAVVAMLLQPAQRLFHRRWRWPGWVAAVVVTSCSMLIVVGPLVAISWTSFAQLHDTVSALAAKDGGVSPRLEGSPVDRTHLEEMLAQVSQRLGVESQRVRTTLAASAGELEQALFARSMQILGSVPRVLLNVVLFAVAVFFLLKDGEQIADTWDEISPLGAAHDQTIRSEFVTVFRGVVWGTVAAALAQGVAFAAGFLVLDLAFRLGLAEWALVLTVLTLIAATIPFLGSVAVWAPTAVGLFLTDHRAAGITLGLYGALVISQVDTLIRVWVLRDTAKLHPLLALVCVFGGIMYFGILGVFLGPIIGALLMALLRILKRELRDPTAMGTTQPAALSAATPQHPAPG